MKAKFLLILLTITLIGCEIICPTIEEDNRKADSITTNKTVSLQKKLLEGKPVAVGLP